MFQIDAAIMGVACEIEGNVNASVAGGTHPDVAWQLALNKLQGDAVLEERYAKSKANGGGVSGG